MGSSCQLLSSEVDMSGVIDIDTHNHSHDSHKHDSHKHDSHSEIVATYRFNCNQFSGFSTTLFEHFNSLSKINAVWVTDDQQGSTEITASRNTVSLD
jgi:5-deoxy-D-glucuronate isomerase